jgi:hypothetical protein
MVEADYQHVPPFVARDSGNDIGGGSMVAWNPAIRGERVFDA